MRVAKILPRLALMRTMAENLAALASAQGSSQPWVLDLACGLSSHNVVLVLLRE